MNRTIVEFVVSCGHDVSACSSQQRAGLLPFKQDIPSSPQELITCIDAQSTWIGCLRLFANGGNPSMTAVASSVVVSCLEAKLLPILCGGSISAARR